MKVFVELVESLNHQAQFVALVPPIAGKTLFSNIVRGKATNFSFGNLKGTLVVNVLMVA